MGTGKAEAGWALGNQETVEMGAEALAEEGGFEPPDRVQHGLAFLRRPQLAALPLLRACHAVPGCWS